MRAVGCRQAGLRAVSTRIPAPRRLTVHKPRALPQHIPLASAASTTCHACRCSPQRRCRIHSAAPHAQHHQRRVAARARQRGGCSGDSNQYDPNSNAAWEAPEPATPPPPPPPPPPPSEPQLPAHLTRRNMVLSVLAAGLGVRAVNVLSSETQWGPPKLMYDSDGKPMPGWARETLRSGQTFAVKAIDGPNGEPGLMMIDEDGNMYYDTGDKSIGTYVVSAEKPPAMYRVSAPVGSGGRNAKAPVVTRLGSLDEMKPVDIRDPNGAPVNVQSNGNRFERSSASADDADQNLTWVFDDDHQLEIPLNAVVKKQEGAAENAPIEERFQMIWPEAVYDGDIDVTKQRKQDGLFGDSQKDAEASRKEPIRIQR